MQQVKGRWLHADSVHRPRHTRGVLPVLHDLQRLDGVHVVDGSDGIPNIISDFGRNQQYRLLLAQNYTTTRAGASFA